MKKINIIEKPAVMMIVLLIIINVLGTTACDARQTTDNAAEQSTVSTAAAAELHVSADGSDTNGDGTIASPYATVSRAAQAAPGSLIIVHEGSYGPFELDKNCSGREDSPTVIRAAEGETVVVRAEGEPCISIRDASHIIIEGLETEGGSHGIMYESSREAGDEALCGITIRRCTVHGVRGIHGIGVYSCNDLAPVSDLTVEDCEVFDCDCGSSESVVLNGNIDGFLIAGNRIHDNNNIGIDMIGFEGLAVHPDDENGKNPYEVDQVRNGVCRDNLVYNISSEGNAAYFEDGEYDLCADGIYVDGGRDIEIYNNFIFNCDIGLEVATEHSPEDNELFRVTGVSVHDNVIADCGGWTGICFGGYDIDLGFTEDCVFDHNTLVDNDTQIGIQRSRNNRVYANLILGGGTGVEYSEECREEDMKNEISGNLAAEFEDEDSWDSEFGTYYDDRQEIADGLRSLTDDIGSRFVPDEEMMEIYHGNS